MDRSGWAGERTASNGAQALHVLKCYVDIPVVLEAADRGEDWVSIEGICHSYLGMKDVKLERDRSKTCRCKSCISEKMQEL